MKIMCDLYSRLKNLNYFIDNEYLIKYCQLVQSNKNSKIKHHNVNKHHIIPRCWFNLNNLTVDNSISNLVKLDYRYHVLAHYYLCLCTRDNLLFANELALVCLLSRNKLNVVDKHLLHSLPLYNNIYEDYTNKCKSNYKIYEKISKDDNKSNC